VALFARPLYRHRGLLAWLFLALAAVAVQRWLWPEMAAHGAPSDAARWIWATSDRFSTRPLGFFMVREFTLARPPAQATLLLAGDEEYSVYLNGVWIGANRYHPGAALDAFAVGSLLQDGENRLVAELHSSQGPGGFLVRLIDGSGVSLLVSDEHFRVLRSEPPGLFEHREWPAGEAPMVWGASPMGRWGSPVAGPLQPPLGNDRSVSPAARFQPWHGEWQKIGWSMSRTRPFGQAVTFDWGATVEGFLALDFTGKEAQPALVAFGDAAPASEPLRADALVVRVPARTCWYDSVPRRFRYATVIGLDEVAEAKVYDSAPARTLAELRREQRRGLFGLAVGPLRTPAEDEIWGELQGLPRRPGRELGEGGASRRRIAFGD